METAYIIRNGVIIGSGTNSSLNPDYSLVDKQDFRIFKSLEEFNEKKGTSFTVVSGVDNMVDIANAMSEGDMLIITTKCTTGSEIYFGLDSSTGWTKMFTLTRIAGLCDIKCTTSAVKNLTRVLAGSTLTDWQGVCTTTVADVGVTTISMSSTYTDGADCKYQVINGICYVNFLSGAYKLTSDVAGVVLATGLPIPKAGSVSVTYIPWGFSDSSCRQVILFVEGDGKMILHAYSNANSGSMFYSFSYPVAES